MSSQANVQSIELLKDFRVALALFGEDMLSALGAAESELRRTLQWLQQEQPAYWQDQIKRRQERLAQARAEVFKRKLQKTADYNPAMSEQKENLRRAEAAVVEAEKKLVMVRKWQPVLQQAALEYHGTIQRLKDLSAGDVPSAVNLLTRLVDLLESYLRLAAPSGAVAGETGVQGSLMGSPIFTTIAAKAMDEQDAIDAAKVDARPTGDASSAVDSRVGDPTVPG
jgi:hypothetical protein